MIRKTLMVIVGCFLATSLSGAVVIAPAGAAPSNATMQVTSHVDAKKSAAETHKLPKRIEGCKNRLARTLYKAGFRGKNLREAWAIVMRESHGHPRSISRTNDFGLFQINKATWSKQKWWKEHRMLDPHYNARVAYRMSKGGKSWLPWGLDGAGRPNPALYRGAGWSPQQIQQWIVKPYQKYYKQFPCTS